MGLTFPRVASLAFATFFASSAASAANYVQHNLVSDIPGLADRTDPNLVNAWGIVHSAGSPWWVNANGTGISELFDGAGQAFPLANPLVVLIPPPSGPTPVTPPTGATPTGVVFNGTSDFQIAKDKPAIFLFVTEDGTISGWNPGVDLTHAVIMVPSSPGAVYKGATLGQNGGANFLFVANFRGGTVDVYDKTFTQVVLGAGAFLDGTLPAGFAPFNVQNINGNIFVAFAKQDDAKHDEVDGAKLGFVDVFDTAGNLKMRLQHGPWFNAPWGMTLAPDGFGKLSDLLLIGNFGSGRIAAFDPASGGFRGHLNGQRGPLTIDGLWGIGFGNGANAGSATTLFFAAGIDSEAHGLFGTITPAQHDRDGHDEDNEDNDNNDQ
ncbi:MAG TPA: TIGR03118 family protein [Candidatus Solibacter sp.]|nr:TIGR03118 family protein [Candidatus Solibacter sp.]